MANSSSHSKPLTPAVYHVLLALAGGPLHGYAISRDVDNATAGAVPMGPGTLYGSLQRMTEAGLVRNATGVESDASHEDRRRYYRLTDAGRAALQAEARRLEHAVDLARRRSVLDGG